MLYYKDNQWHICPFIAHYTSHGKKEFKYTNDKKWWENFVDKWWHHENLTFEPVNPTDEQIARLDEVNNANIPEGNKAEASTYVEYGYVQDKDNPHFEGFSDQQDAFDKFIAEKAEEIEEERVKRTELMPYTTPDGEDVEVKLLEEPPNKPRQTWLSGTCSWGLAEVQDNNPDETDDLIAADDTTHTMKASDWVEFGKKMKKWVKDNLMAAKQHVQNVKDLESIEEIKDYDYTTNYWPS
ncbi:MAG: hypothetical protein ACOC22_02450 [bacterium]